MHKILYILILFSFSCVSEEPEEFVNSVLSEVSNQKNFDFNKTVTDKEIVEYFQLMYKYQSSTLDRLENQTPEERRQFIRDYRKAYNDLKLKIPTLRGISKEELAQLDQVAKYNAELMNEAESAVKRISELDNKQISEILSESITFILENKHSFESNSERVVLKNDFPAGLTFLKPKYIYLYKNSCLIFLQKGIGKGIGYSVSMNRDKVWEISSFNQYESWDNKTLLTHTVKTE